MRRINLKFLVIFAISLVIAGGGGYGDPLERDTSLVLRDVKRGYYTPAEAQELFSVILTKDLDAIDEAATAALRAQ